MRKDRRGIEGLPLRLMLVALLISLTLPTMLSLLNSTTSSIIEERGAEIAEKIATTIEEMSAGGPGNVRFVKVPVDLPASIVIHIGGENGTIDCTRITWTADGCEGARYLAGVIMFTDNGKVLTISAGDSLRLECSPGAWGEVKVALA